MDNRLNAIDIAKGIGIGIILVVIGHLPLGRFLVRFIYDFHMPLFFFLSGLFLDENKYYIKRFVLSRITSLIIPLISFCAFAVLLQLIPSFDFRHPSLGIGGAALWFLPVLFCAECLIYCMWRLFHRTIQRVVLVLLCFMVAMVVSKSSFRLPTALHAVPFAAAMFASGTLLKDFVSSYIMSNKKNDSFDLVVPFVCFIIIGLLAYFFKDYTNMYNGHIAFGVLGILVAFCRYYRNNRLVKMDRQVRIRFLKQNNYLLWA